MVIIIPKIKPLKKIIQIIAKKNYLKDFTNDNNKIPIMDRLNDIFGKGFRCNKCLSLLDLKIDDSKNERGELYIEGKYMKNHVVKKNNKRNSKSKRTD